MELKKVKEDEKILIVEMSGETITLPNLIRDELWNDKNVSEAAYIKEHPYLAEPKIFVKVKRGKPITALKKVSNRIMSQLEEFKDKFKSSLKT